MALIADSIRLEHEEIDRLAVGIDDGLEARGVPRSTPIAFRALAEPRAVTFALALFRLGRPLLPLHARWTRAEVERALSPLTAVVALSNDDVAELLERARRSTSRPLPEPPGESLAAIVFTSGTNGAPKAIALDRSAFVASARASERNLTWRNDDRWLLGLPFAHVGGLSILTRTSLARKTITLAPSDPEALLACKATLVSLVPTQLHRLLELDRENRLAGFRAVLVGGAEFPEELRSEAERRGIVTLASYGLSETCSQIATQSPTEDRRANSLDSGRALEGVELRVRDGRIQVRGPMLMRGYIDAPRLARDEFFTTGDLGSIDETGRLFVLGRADDVLITGGENVHPVEIERALSKCARVKSSLCFGIPDARWGQLVAVALVLEPRSDDLSDVESVLSELARFKRPRCFAIVNELPLGVTGKPDRSRARHELVREMKLWPALEGHDTM